MVYKFKLFNYIFLYFAALFIILDCYSVWHNTLATEFTVTAVILSIILSIPSILNLLRRNGKYIFAFLFLYFATMILFYYFNAMSDNKTFILKYFIWLPLMVNYFYYGDSIKKMKDFFLAIENIMLYISIISLFFYIFGTLLGWFQPTSTININWGHFTQYNSYFGIYFEGHIVEIAGIMVTRNIGIFIEGPMFSFCLCIALYIELFINKSTGKWRILLLIITTITVLSTTGLISIVLLLLLKYIQRQGKGLTFQKLSLSIIIPLVASIGIYLIAQKINTGSGMIRADDLQAGYNAWLNNKLFGVGIDNVSGINPYKQISWRQDYGTSMGVVKAMAEGGVVLVLVYVLPFIFALKNIIKNKNFTIIGGFIIMFELVFSTIVCYKLLVLLCVSMMWAYTLKYIRT